MIESLRVHQVSGRSVVIADGHNITDRVRRVAFDFTRDALPKVTLELQDLELTVIVVRAEPTLSEEAAHAVRSGLSMVAHRAAYYAREGFYSCGTCGLFITEAPPEVFDPDWKLQCGHSAFNQLWTRNGTGVARPAPEMAAAGNKPGPSWTDGDSKPAPPHGASGLTLDGGES